MRNQSIRTLKMFPDEWQRLEQLAIETNSRPTKGIHARVTTWPALIRRIANGELLVVEPAPYPMPAGLDDAVRQLEQRQQLEAEQLAAREAEQLRLEEHRQRIAEATKPQRKMPLKMPVKMEQLHMELEAEPA
jgi:hypothetical protein